MMGRLIDADKFTKQIGRTALVKAGGKDEK